MVLDARILVRCGDGSVPDLTADPFLINPPAPVGQLNFITGYVVAYQYAKLVALVASMDFKSTSEVFLATLRRTGLPAISSSSSSSSYSTSNATSTPTSAVLKANTSGPISTRGYDLEGMPLSGREALCGLF